MASNDVNLLTFIKQLDGEEKWRKLSTEDGERSRRKTGRKLMMCTHRTEETILRGVRQTGDFKQSV